MYSYVTFSSIAPQLLVEPLTFDLRPESGGVRYPTARREEPGRADSDDDRGSGEYFSGEEYQEDDIMLHKDRYHHGNLYVLYCSCC